MRRRNVEKKNKSIPSIDELLVDDTLCETLQTQKMKAVSLSLDAVLEHLLPKKPVDITSEHRKK